METGLRKQVIERARSRCEYCNLHQEQEPFYRFHIEHIIPKQHGGGDEEGNLALACHYCNLHKGPNLSGIDAETGIITTLFHPRRQQWDDHFTFVGPRIHGLSPVGRATVSVLAMNTPIRLELRGELRSNNELM
jgi:hypothetical protein